MVFVLIICCFIILICAYLLFNRSIINPTFLISLGFFFSSLNLELNQTLWKFHSSFVVFMIIGGLIMFMVGSYIVSLFFRNKEVISIPKINFTSLKLRMLLYAIFQLLLYLVILVFIIRSQGGGFSPKGISNSLSSFHEQNLLGLTSLPGILNILNILNMSGVYLLFYLLFYFKFNKGMIPKSILLNVIIALVGSLFTGNRTVFTMYVVAMFIIYYFDKQKSEKKLAILNFKSFFFLLLIIVLFFMLFLAITSLQGRNQSNMSLVYNLSTYLGGPLKNLEIFVNKNIIINQIFGGQTFMNTYNWLSTSFGIPNFKITSLYNYNWIFESGLGNVYSIYMPLYSDFGLYGTFVFMFFLGIFSQYIYSSALFKKPKYQISYFTIFYSYLGFSLIMSFFSNKIGESIFSRAGLYFIIGLWIFDLLLCRPILSNGEYRDGFKKN